MPWVKVEMSSGRSVEQKRAAAEAITQAMVDHCNCSAESVSIVFADVTDENWSMGGELILDRKAKAAK